jgi:hypothetical protein
MGLGDAQQAGRGRWRIEDRLGDGALILDGEPNNLSFFNGACGGLLGRGDDEIADTSALEFGRALDDGQSFGSDARLDARGAVFLSHRFALFVPNYDGISPDKKADGDKRWITARRRMSFSKGPGSKAEALGCGSLAPAPAGARPDQREALAVLVGKEVGVDRSGKARIVELEAEIVAALGGALGPSGADFDIMRSSA